MVALEISLSKAMNARIIGSGSETIALAHGFGGDQSVWDKIIPELEKHYQILVFDWIFSGAVKENQEQLFDPEKYSCYDGFAEDLICLIEEMNLNSLLFIGHSMSGMIGCIASIKRPQLFKRLILIGASPRYINTDDDYEGGFKKSDIDDLISSIETNFENWAKGFPSVVVDAKDPLSVDKFAKSLANMKPEIALSVAKTVFYCDEREILDKVSTPCTIIQPTNDIIVPNSVAYYMQEKISAKSTVEIIETNGHFPHLTSHQQFLDLLAAVLGFSTT